MWVKNHHVLGRADYHYRHEPFFYGWKKGATHNFYGGGLKSTAWDIKRPENSDLHPTMKPVELILEILKNSSKEEDIVLDLFLGSGTSVIAAEKSNRICYGIEIDPFYCDVIIKRWEEYTGKKAEKL